MVCHLSTVLLVLLSLAASAAAQVVSPVSRVLVLETGSSAKVSIDAGDCDPSWTAVSGNADIARVSPDAYDNGSKRSFTIEADADDTGNTTITVDLDDGDCVGESSIVFTVYVVDIAPATLSKLFGKGLAEGGITGTKARLKTLKGSLKVAEKALAADYKDLLAELKAGTLSVDELAPPPPGGVTLRDHEIALIRALDDERLLADAVWDAWFAAAGLSAADGNDLLVLGGYLPGVADDTAVTTPVDFQRGGGGLWDDVTGSAWVGALTTLGRGQLQAEKFHDKLEKASDIGARIHGLTTPPLDIAPLLEGPAQLSLFPQTSPGLDTRPHIVAVRASNHVDDGTSNGRLYILGRGPALDTLDVSMQRLSGGFPEGDSIDREVELLFSTLWTLVEPPADTAAELGPGTWQITVSDGDTEVVQVIDIPVL